jgi:DNA-binding MarR family transcriptional regulator
VDDIDLTPLGLSPTATTLLGHVLRHGGRSVSRLALETGIADSMVSRAVRLLEERGLVTRRWGRSAPVTVAAGADGVLRAEGGEAPARW